MLMVYQYLMIGCFTSRPMKPIEQSTDLRGRVWCVRDELFTTGNLDNIDHNPTSTSSQGAFHGTALSITQHVTHDNHGVQRTSEVQEPTVQSKSIKPLPDSYTTVPPISLPDNTT